ncbi:tRNA (adenosine(37)-N6)-threonylcarbamoyltransferase complex dimerization subunit type 1 TsaB [Lacibacter sp. MH-610]|uniref:tRNA (adenosine(37)-N6)-threonylcarbamoyltransferase complex dimerization subunit type 1 TsaB n=1 Tax=Lacibacter sp. MH-610 TaxID=3020883 RepID=UPI00389141DC
MSSNYLLCIDTSVQSASVALTAGSRVLGIKSSDQPRDHAAFLQPAIEQLLHETNIKASQLNAVAVTSGPGSYTGLRVGMASAKGLCFGLNIPLITLPTTEVMCVAALQQLSANDSFLLAPMIDARRMEVFTALYTQSIQTVKEPHACILQTDSFNELLQEQILYFFGNGAEKWKTLCSHSNARFLNANWSAADMVVAAFTKFQQKDFAYLAYAAPFYGKDFHSTSKN